MSEANVNEAVDPERLKQQFRASAEKILANVREQIDAAPPEKKTDTAMYFVGLLMQMTLETGLRMEQVQRDAIRCADIALEQIHGTAEAIHRQLTPHNQ